MREALLPTPRHEQPLNSGHEKPGRKSTMPLCAKMTRQNDQMKARLKEVLERNALTISHSRRTGADSVLALARSSGAQSAAKVRSSEFDRMLCSGGKGGSKLIEPDLGSGSLIGSQP